MVGEAFARGIHKGNQQLTRDAIREWQDARGDAWRQVARDAVRTRISAQRLSRASLRRASQEVSQDNS